MPVKVINTNSIRSIFSKFVAVFSYPYFLCRIFSVPCFERPPPPSCFIRNCSSLSLQLSASVHVFSTFFLFTNFLLFYLNVVCDEQIWITTNGVSREWYICIIPTSNLTGVWKVPTASSTTDSCSKSPTSAFTNCAAIPTSTAMTNTRTTAVGY